MKHLTFILILSTTINLYSQKDFSYNNVRPKYSPTLEIKDTQSDTVETLVFSNDITDSLGIYIDSLAVLYKKRPMYVRGYSVKVYNGMNIEEAKTLRSHVLTKFPKEYAFMDYVPPNSRLKVGEFRQKVYAQQLKEKLMQKGFTGLIGSASQNQN